MREFPGGGGERPDRQERAQFSEYVIKGVVKEKGSTLPLESAAIRIIQTKDSSTVVAGGAASRDGSFEIKLERRGRFYIEISYLGYGTQKRQMRFSGQTNVADMGTIYLDQDAIALKGAVIEGKAPEVVVKEDTIEYNAESYKLQPNSMIEDLLKKLPGVEVDSEGNVTSGGKTINKILVDGKEFFSDDPKVASRNINVEIVEKLQVIDRKSEEARLTGVDDGEDEKVINLTIKKGMKKGWFGNIAGSYGDKDRYLIEGMANRFWGENQFSLIGNANNINKSAFSDRGSNIFSGSNMRNSASGGIKESANIGANFNLGKSDDFRVGGSVLFAPSEQNIDKRTDRENYIGDSTSYYNSSDRSVNKSTNISAAFRMEWKIDSLTKLDVEPTVSYNKTQTTRNSEYSTLGMHNQYINRGVSMNFTDMDGISYSAKMTLSRGSATRPGRRSSVTFHYSGNQTDGVSFMDSELIFGDEDFPGSEVKDSIYNQKQLEKINKNTFRVRATHVEPLGKNFFFQTAYQYSQSETLSERFSYLQTSEDTYSNEVDSAYSDNFKNRFIDQRISLSIRKREQKYNYSVGIDLQPSSSESVNYFDDDQSYDRSVFNLSPALEYTYLWDKRTSLRFHYRGRTQQPSVSQLQPSKNNSNPLIVREGNLDLDPSYNNSLNIRYNKYKPESQQTIQAMLNGSMTFNNIVNQSTYSEDGVQTIKPINVNGVWNADGRFMFSAPLKNQRWQVNTNSNVRFSRQVGYTQGERNISKTLTGTERFGITYRSDFVDVGLEGNYSVSNVVNSVGKNLENTTQSYGGLLSLTVYPIQNLTVSSNLNYSNKLGYSSSFDYEMYILNAEVNYTLLKSRKANVFFRAYDLLKQRSENSRSVTATYMQDVVTNALTDYFLVGFSYKFNTMGAGPGNMKGNNRQGPPGGRMRDF